MKALEPDVEKDLLRGCDLIYLSRFRCVDPAPAHVLPANQYIYEPPSSPSVTHQIEIHLHWHWHWQLVYVENLKQCRYIPDFLFSRCQWRSRCRGFFVEMRRI